MSTNKIDAEKRCRQLMMAELDGEISSELRMMRDTPIR